MCRSLPGQLKKKHSHIKKPQPHSFLHWVNEVKTSGTYASIRPSWGWGQENCRHFGYDSWVATSHQQQMTSRLVLC